jgi:hypothetical protein
MCRLTPAYGGRGHHRHPARARVRQREEVCGQLRVAFGTRVVLEQAKGVVAEAAGVGVDDAFAVLRHYARHHNLLLSEVARRVAGRDLAAGALAIRPATRGSRRR